MKIYKTIFKWEGINHKGKKITGKLYALNIQQAEWMLKERNIVPLKIRKIYQLFSSLQNKKNSSKEISVFFRQLSTLISTGIPIINALQLLLQNHKKNSLHQLIDFLITKIISGQTLSSSLQHYPEYFDALTWHLIYVGEQTGTVDLALIRIAQQKEKQLLLKQHIKQALLYPFIITFVASIVTLIMLLFVVPHFAELFQTFHGKLPIFTIKVIQISVFLHLHYFCILIFMLLIPTLLFFSRKFLRFKTLIDRLLLTLPILREVYLNILSANFSRVFAVIMTAGIPISDALKLLNDISTNEIYKRAIATFKLEIAAGHRIYEAMQVCAFFPDLLLQMVKIGEESGTLDTMLAKSAEFYEADITYWTKNFTHLLEPLIIIILGVLIGGLVIAMYLPIFKLGTFI